jgi:hypothetical protein
MANDIVVKFRADDKNLVKTLEKLVQLQQKVSKRAQKQAAELKKVNEQLRKTGTRAKKAGKGFTDITNSGRLLNNTFATMRSKLLLVSFGFGLVTAAVSKNIDSFAKQEESVARMALQFGSNASRELDKYSSSLQEVTRFGDENINMVMSTFGAYGASIEQTKRLTAATLDLAEGEQMDLTTASRLVAKSFASSTNALNRYGIEVDNTASKEVKIQQIISASQEKYGGLAEALGGLSGSDMVKARNAFSDLTEELGGVLIQGFSPVIQAITAFNQSLGGAPIRMFTQLITGLAAAYLFLQIKAIGAPMVAAVAKAATVTAGYNAILIGTGRTALSAAGKIKIFSKALITSTGGLGAMLIAGGFAIATLFELFGAFGKTAEETEKADKRLDKFAGNIKKFDTSPAVKKLDDFYDKLVEGNQILKLQNFFVEGDLMGTLNNLKNTFTQLTTEEEKLVALHFNAQAGIDGLSTNFIGLTKGTLAYDMAVKQSEKNQEMWNKTLDRADVQAAVAKYKILKGEIAGFKQVFIDATGVSESFFEEYIEGAGIVDAVESGVITTNEELLKVIQESANIQTELNEAIRLGQDEKVQQLIAEIVEQVKLLGIKEKNLEFDKKYKKWKDMEADERLGQIGDFVGALGSLAQGNKDTALAGAWISLAAAAINIAEGVTNDIKLGASPLKIATTIALGAAQIQKIYAGIAQMQSVDTTPKASVGGYIGGRPHSLGGTMIEAERGEFIMSKAAVDSIGLENVNQMNQTGFSGNNITVNVSGNVLTQDFVEGELAESIKEAVRRGGDFGMS